MNPVHHITQPDPFLRGIVAAAFPAYSGKKFKIEVHACDGPTPPALDVRSYWDGGSRDYFAIVQTSTGKIMPIPAQSAFDRQLPGADAAPIMPGLMIVENSIFCGKELGITFHVRADEVAPLLPEPVTVTVHERLVLAATRGLIARGTARLDESGLSRAQWDAAAASLKTRGLLTKAGAITPDGRNAIGRATCYDIQREATRAAATEPEPAPTPPPPPELPPPAGPSPATDDDRQPALPGAEHVRAQEVTVPPIAPYVDTFTLTAPEETQPRTGDLFR